MNLITLFNIVIAPAVICFVTYSPLLLRLTRSLVSPYPKADVGRRVFAAAVDGLIVASTAVLYWNSSFLPSLVGGIAYVVLRDGMSRLRRPALDALRAARVDPLTAIRSE